MAQPRLARESSSVDLTQSSKQWRVGDFSIGNKVLGHGTFAEVRLAMHLRTGEPAAVKIVAKSRLSAYERGLMDTEIKAMHGLVHPNIVRLYQHSEDAFNIYIIMEYLRGTDLLSWLCSKGTASHLSEAQARKLFSQIVDAVAYLHGKAIAHRDLKLENIMVDSDLERAVIIDFGLCGFIEPGKLMSVYCGSPAYAAPELVQRVPYDGKATDVWALGVCLFAMVFGDYPFEGDDIGTLYGHIVYTRPALPESATSELKHLILAMLAKDSEQRITVAGIMRHPWMTGLPAAAAEPVRRQQQPGGGTPANLKERQQPEVTKLSGRAHSDSMMNVTRSLHSSTSCVFM